MVHVDYDSTLVIVSILVAVVICYAAVSMEELVFKAAYKKFEKSILVTSGLILGLAIWSMHFVGMLASHLPEGYHFDVGLTLLSYLIGAVASIFAVWLTSRQTLPLARLILGAVFMGLGISGMHYTGMMALTVEYHQMYYDPLLVICSILIAISGSGLSFFFIFKYKAAANYRITLKVIVAVLMALSIVGMHYIGMAATYFNESLVKVVPPAQTEQSVLLFTIIFITSLVFVAGFAVALLEARLEQRNQQLKLINKQLATQSLHDALTKLPNRLYLTDYAEVVFTHHRLREQKVAFLYIDLDRFKSVNDAFGHHVGDQLLIQMANRLHNQLEANQRLFRIGGDEFVLISENTDSNGAMQLAESILYFIQETYLIAGKDINISASLGIAMYPEHGSNVQDLLINADIAMLMSKDQGRNTYTIFHAMTDQKDVRSQSKLINDLYKAVDEQQFILFYQPKFTANYEVCGVEALIRWNHPSLGLLTPHMFIDGAEKTGLIIPMGYWALEQACQQIQKWEQENSPFYPIAVNLSALQFENKKLFSVLEQLIEQYNIQPQHLILEITESTAMHHIDSSIRTLERLRKLGIRIAIDDFGTGYSSFLYLKDLPVDELKIDRGFIIDLQPNSKEEAILESIIHLAAKLGLTVTAEGVETQQQADILTKLGCHQLQGYLLGTPVNIESLVLHRQQNFA
ncbi:EAL domain-containing protein [Acinetobacter sp. NIPH 2699]|uniref:bifunctional diguanylate cyclase/phosphodiesterase n=1 Tax=Acinetobacter sp. NIPH 2699 TaxID=2923433 RepID=UPI001F4B6D4F|nr:EAL domain-containing protein [Acinetobacter sp. NIPH 2699]MCH7337609.1 EAL domain-containing protein [Acinetobacter sp. NIPH 2699]